MTSVAAGLFKALPKPRYTGEDEDLPVHAQPRGLRVVGTGSIDESQIALKVSPFPLFPAYLGMANWWYSRCSKLGHQHMAMFLLSIEFSLLCSDTLYNTYNNK